MKRTKIAINEEKNKSKYKEMTKHVEIGYRTKSRKSFKAEK